MPKSLECYFQESGRAGRDGRPARSVLYFSVDELGWQLPTVAKTDRDNVRIRGCPPPAAAAAAEGAVRRDRRSASLIGRFLDRR